MHRARVLSFVVSVLVPACGAGSSTGSPDAGADCADPTAALPAGYLPIAEVSAGAVTSTAGGTATTTLVDASAGGFGGSDTEPFVYLAFSGTDAAKVAITDVTSYDDDTWHLALKRYVVRANGGDSGPGGVEVASVDAASLDAVTTVPPAAMFGVDDWATADCELVADGLGAPLTAMGLWYEAADGTLTPRPLVYVLALPGGDHVKLRVDSYYANPSDATQSGYFRLEWAPL